MSPPPVASQRPSALKVNAAAAVRVPVEIGPSGRRVRRSQKPSATAAVDGRQRAAVRCDRRALPSRPPGSGIRPIGRSVRLSKRSTRAAASVDGELRAVRRPRSAGAAAAAPVGAQRTLEPPVAVEVPSDHRAVAAGAERRASVGRDRQAVDEPAPRARSVSVAAARRVSQTISRSSRPAVTSVRPSGLKPHRGHRAVVAARGGAHAAGAEVEQAHGAVARSERDQAARSGSARRPAPATRERGGRVAAWRRRGSTVVRSAGSR